MWTLERENHGYGYHCHVCYNGRRTQFLTTMSEGHFFLCEHGEAQTVVNVPGENVLSQIRTDTIIQLLQFDEQGACLRPREKCVEI